MGLKDKHSKGNMKHDKYIIDNENADLQKTSDAVNNEISGNKNTNSVQINMASSSKTLQNRQNIHKNYAKNTNRALIANNANNTNSVLESKDNLKKQAIGNGDADKAAGGKKSGKRFTPASYGSKNELIDKSKFTDAEIAAAKAEVERERTKEEKLNIFSLIWTLLSSVFAIISTAVYISTKWIDSTLAYVLIVLLIAYIMAFIFMVALSFKDPRSTTRNARLYKRLLSIFKTFINIAFLVLTAINMIALAKSESTVKWLFFIISLVVAVIQLGVKIALLIFRWIRRRTAKKYKVRVRRYVDGEVQSSTASDRITEKIFKK